MTPTLLMIRNAVFEAIENQMNQLVITDFDLIATYYPKTELQTLAKPRVFVIPMQWSEDKLTRNSARSLELPVQIAVQQKVTPTDTPTIDLLICFVEELNRICAKLNCTQFVWLRTEPMRDPNNTPISYMALHEQHLFQATFTAYYQSAVC